MASWPNALRFARVFVALSIGAFSASAAQTDARAGAPDERLVVLRESGLARVEGRIAFPISDAAHSGLAAQGRERVPHVLAGAMRRRGSERLPAAAIDKWLADHGAEIALDGDSFELRCDFACARGDLGELLARVAAMLGDSKVPADVIAKVDAAWRDEHQRLQNDQRALPDRWRLYDALDVADRRVDERSAAAASIPAAAFEEFHHATIARDNAWVALLGDIEPAEARRALEPCLAALAPKRAADAPTLRVAPPRASRARVRILDVPARKATELRVRLRASDGQDLFGARDYPNVRLAAELAVRSRDFDPAGVWSVVPAMEGMPLYLYANASGENLAQTIAALDRFQEVLRAASRETLDNVRQRLVQRERERARSPRIRLASAIAAAQGRTQRDEWERYLAQLESATLDDVRGGSSPKAVEVCVAVGPASELDALFRAHELTPAITTARERPTGAALCDRMFAALGGRERWRTLAGVATQSSVRLPGTNAEVSLELWADFEGKRFCAVQSAGAVQTTATQQVAYVVTASSGFVKNGVTASDLPAEQTKNLRTRHEHWLFQVLRQLARGDRLIADADVDGRIVITSDGAPWCTLELGPDARPTKLFYTDESGAAITYEFSEWAERDGFPYPARALQVERSTDARTVFFQANPTFEPGLFERGG